MAFCIAFTLFHFPGAPPAIRSLPFVLLPAPAPWPYIADFTRPEGLQRRTQGSGHPLLAQAAGVEPAHLGVKVPCLTIWLRLHMPPLGHIVERGAESGHVGDLGAEVWIMNAARTV